MIENMDVHVKIVPGSFIEEEKEYKVVSIVSLGGTKMRGVFPSGERSLLDILDFFGEDEWIPWNKESTEKMIIVSFYRRNDERNVKTKTGFPMSFPWK